MTQGDFQMGDRVRDVATGFEGIVVGRVRYIASADQSLVAPVVSSQGEWRAAQWIDDGRLQPLAGERVVGFQLKT